MQKRRLGQTEIEVSILGLGTVKFGRNEGVKYPIAFSLPSLAACDALISRAFDLGINLLDTAPAYGESELRLGQLLKNKRKDWVISTKVGEQFVNGKSYYDFSAQHLRQSVDDSLKRLATDYLDIVLVHSNGDDEYLIYQKNVFAALAALKESGKIRAYGMSSKTLAGGLATIDLADIAMVTYNPLHGDEKPVIAYAHKQQKGIFIKKAFASGNLKASAMQNENPYAYALRYVLQEPGVTSVIVGTINAEHLQMCGEVAGNNDLIFLDYPSPAATPRPLPQGER